MFNSRDTETTVSFLHALVCKAKESNNGVPAPVLAFDMHELAAKLNNIPTRKLRNSNKVDSFVAECNDLLAANAVCDRLGGVYTIMEFEWPIMFLVDSTYVESYTERLVPEERFARYRK